MLKQFLVSLAIVLSVAGVSLTPAADGIPPPRPAVATPPPGWVPPTTTRVAIPIDHPVGLREAVALAATLDETVVAYAFQNRNFSGEYSPNSGRTVDEFLAGFEAQYSTQPQVTAFIVERAVDMNSVPSVPGPRNSTPVESSIPEAGAEPMTPGGEAEEVFESSPPAPTENAVTSPAEPGPRQPDPIAVVGGLAAIFLALGVVIVSLIRRRRPSQTRDS